jgi:hypothetical protein
MQCADPAVNLNFTTQFVPVNIVERKIKVAEPEIRKVCYV